MKKQLEGKVKSQIEKIFSKNNIFLRIEIFK